MRVTKLLLKIATVSAITILFFVVTIIGCYFEIGFWALKTEPDSHETELAETEIAETENFISAPRNNELAFPIMGANSEELEVILAAICEAPAGARGAAASITVYPEWSDHFKHHHPDCKKEVMAHCHDNGEVCVRAAYAKRKEIIRHEITHAYRLSLPEQVSAEFQKLSDFEYGSNYESGEFPARGILNPNGASSFSEDIAEWVEAIYELNTGLDHPLHRIKDGADPVYLAKLNFFRRWKFITEEEYQKAVEFFSNR